MARRSANYSDVARKIKRQRTQRLIGWLALGIILGVLVAKGIGIADF